MTEKPTVDREFAEKFLRSVDTPLDYGVYFLFHDWWEKAPQEAIDAYAAELASMPEAADCLRERCYCRALVFGPLVPVRPGHTRTRLSRVYCRQWA